MQDFITNNSIVQTPTSAIATKLCHYSNNITGPNFVPFCLPVTSLITSEPLFLRHYLVNTSVADTVGATVTIGEWQTFNVNFTLAEGEGFFNFTYPLLKMIGRLPSQ